MTSKYRKLLLVDDDADDRMVFVEILQELDTELILECAENGLEMLEILGRNPDAALPDIIVLDQNMPRMTGKESLIYLKANSRYRHIPVILYSTYQVRDFYLECLQLGADDVVTKPDTLDAYKGMIQRFLRVPLLAAASSGLG
jgi:CheY-like chemotaxis protein